MCVLVDDRETPTSPLHSYGRVDELPRFCRCPCLVSKVRVMEVKSGDSDCSDEFYLMASDEAPEVGDVDGPYLKVTSPTEDDEAYAGEEYTVEVRRMRSRTPA